jgi:hypothetical protein
MAKPYQVKMILSALDKLNEIKNRKKKRKNIKRGWPGVRFSSSGRGRRLIVLYVSGTQTRKHT